MSVHTQAYRRVHGVIAGDLDALTTVRTADDLFLEVAAWDNIRHTRDMLPEFTDLSAALDLQAAVNHIRMVRKIPQPISFSVTANFVGQRNYNYHEIKSAIAAGILRRYPEWIYVEDDRDALLNVRVFIEHERALIGVRLTAAPLHRRAYKQTSLEGSLKPPVAAAMIRLARLEKAQTLLDPFCGSGTIVIEATQQGFTAVGGDINRQALRISRENADYTSGKFLLAQWHSQHLPLANGCVHAVVSNLPWGKQVKVDTSLRLLYQDTYWEMQRVIASGGVIVLLTTFPELIPAAPAESFEISVYGQNPQVMIFR